jgi:hypothetical protein
MDSSSSAEGIRREVVELFDPIGNSLAIGKIEGGRRGRLLLGHALGDGNRKRKLESWVGWPDEPCRAWVIVILSMLFLPRVYRL